MIKWFAANKLLLNREKTNIMKFITNNLSHSALHVGFKVKYMENMVDTKLICLKIDNNPN
jgi:hypothetical protein